MSKQKKLLKAILKRINAPPKDEKEKNKRAKHAKVDSEVERR